MNIPAKFHACITKWTIVAVSRSTIKRIMILRIIILKIRHLSIHAFAACVPTCRSVITLENAFGNIARRSKTLQCVKNISMKISCMKTESNPGCDACYMVIIYISDFQFLTLTEVNGSTSWTKYFSRSCFFNLPLITRCCP